jgi:hypothetical protein
MKARVVEGIDVATARQWCSKHISTVTDTDATTEDANVSMLPVPRL